MKKSIAAILALLIGCSFAGAGEMKPKGKNGNKVATQTPAPMSNAAQGNAKQTPGKKGNKTLGEKSNSVTRTYR